MNLQRLMQGNPLFGHHFVFWRVPSFLREGLQNGAIILSSSPILLLRRILFPGKV